MEFIEKIKAHQEGKYDLAKELLELAQSDKSVVITMVRTEHGVEIYDMEYEENRTKTFYRWRPHYAPKMDNPEHRIAYNLRVLIKRHLREANGQRKTTMFEGTKVEIAENDVLDMIYSTMTGLGYHYYKDDFDKIPKKVHREIEEKYGYYFYERWLDEITEFINILPSINRAKRKLEGEIAPLILESLYEIIPLVDAKRTVDEICGFFTISTRNRTYLKLTKDLGNKVHNINGKKYYVSNKGDKMRKTNVSHLLGVDECKLKSTQTDFYFSLKKFVQIELEAKNTSPFTFNEERDVIDFNKRYFANIMEIEESNFKHKLKRIQSKMIKLYL